MKITIQTLVAKTLGINDIKIYENNYIFIKNLNKKYYKFFIKVNNFINNYKYFKF